MALTAVELARLRRDLGDTAAAFHDTELEDNWTRLVDAPNAAVRFEAVKGLCFEQLLNNASKLHDYSAGAVDEKLSQIVKNLQARFEYYKPALEAARGQKRQVVMSKLGKRAHPTRRRP